MRNIRLLWIPLLALLCVGLAGCTIWDRVFFKAESVDPGDLADFSGTVLPATTTDEEVIGAAFMPVFYTVVFGAQSVMSEEELESANVVGARCAPAFAVLSRLAARAPAPRAITYTNQSDDNTVDVKLTVTDEEYSAASVGGTGTLGVDTFDLTLFAEMDSATTPTTGTARGEVAGTVTVDALDFGMGFVINEGIVNLKAKGDGDVTFTDGEPSSVKYDAAIDLKAGFSMSFYGEEGEEDDVGAKLVVEFNYVEGGDYTAQEIQEIVDGIDEDDYAPMLSSVSLLLKIEVYDNNNALVKSYSFDEEDFAALLAPEEEEI